MTLRDRRDPWPTVHHETLASGAVTTFVSDTVETPSGTIITRQYLEHPGAVCIVPWNEATDEIAVLYQYRHPVGYVLVEIPAGLLDHDGESYTGAAKRELAEEMELQADRWNVLVDVFPSPGSYQETYRIFLARDLAPTSRPEDFVVEGEEAEMTWGFVPRSEVVDAILEGRCQSGALVTGVLALETARLLGRLSTLRPADASWLARDDQG